MDIEYIKFVFGRQHYQGLLRVCALCLCFCVLCFIIFYFYFLGGEERGACVCPHEERERDFGLYCMYTWLQGFEGFLFGTPYIVF